MFNRAITFRKFKKMGDDALVAERGNQVTSEGRPKSRQPLCGYLTLHCKTGLLRSYKSKWFVYW